MTIHTLIRVDNYIREGVRIKRLPSFRRLVTFVIDKKPGVPTKFIGPVVLRRCVRILTHPELDSLFSKSNVRVSFNQVLTWRDTSVSKMIVNLNFAAKMNDINLLE